MRKLLCLLALACVGFAAPANAQNAVANVVQVTTHGNNTSTITQTARNTAVANVAQATIRGNNTSAITQHARNRLRALLREQSGATTRPASPRRCCSSTTTVIADLIFTRRGPSPNSR
jgi:hypothetical protein